MVKAAPPQKLFFSQTRAQQEHPVMECHPERPGQAQKCQMRISGDLITQSVKPRLDGALTKWFSERCPYLWHRTR